MKSSHYLAVHAVNFIFLCVSMFVTGRP